MCAFTRARINEVEEEGEGDPPRGVLPHQAQRQRQWGGRSDGEFDSPLVARSVLLEKFLSMSERKRFLVIREGKALISARSRLEEGFGGGTAPAFLQIT